MEATCAELVALEGLAGVCSSGVPIYIGLISNESSKVSVNSVGMRSYPMRTEASESILQYAHSIL